MNIVFVASDSPEDPADSNWRGAVITSALNRSGRHYATLISRQDFSTFCSISRAACAASDVIVLQGIPNPPLHRALQFWRGRKKTILLDLDIVPSELDLLQAEAGFMQVGSVETMHRLMDIDAVVVASRQLVPALKSYWPVIYLPNYLELDRFYARRKGEHKGVFLGWSGGSARIESLVHSGLLEALQRVCHARPDVRLLVRADRDGALPVLPLPEAQIVYYPWVSSREWGQVLSQLDIGLAPELQSLCGDWMDVLQFMVMRIPWVASDSLTYNDLHPYGWIVKNNPGAWERVLIDMIDHLDSYCHEASAAAYLFGVSHNIDEHIDEIVSAFTRMQPHFVTEPGSPSHNYLAVHHQISSPELATRQLAASKVLISKHTELAALAQANMAAPHLLPLLY